MIHNIVDLSVISEVKIEQPLPSGKGAVLPQAIT